MYLIHYNTCITHLVTTHLALTSTTHRLFLLLHVYLPHPPTLTTGGRGVPWCPEPGTHTHIYIYNTYYIYIYIYYLYYSICTWGLIQVSNRNQQVELAPLPCACHAQPSGLVSVEAVLIFFSHGGGIYWIYLDVPRSRKWIAIYNWLNPTQMLAWTKHQEFRL